MNGAFCPANTAGPAKMILSRRNSGRCSMPSTPATVIDVTLEARDEVHEGLFASTPECVTEIFADLHVALRVIGSVRPHAIVVDLADGDAFWSGLLKSRGANRSFGHSRIPAAGTSDIAGPSEGSAGSPDRVSPRGGGGHTRSLADSRSSWERRGQPGCEFCHGPARRSEATRCGIMLTPGCAAENSAERTRAWVGTVERGCRERAEQACRALGRQRVLRRAGPRRSTSHRRPLPDAQRCASRDPLPEGGPRRCPLRDPSRADPHRHRHRGRPVRDAQPPRPGDVFGEIALLDGHARTAEAIALETTDLFVIDRRDFLELLAHDAALAARIIGFLCRRLRWMSERMEEATLLPLDARLARRLVMLSEDYGAEIQVTQQELAAYVGAARESVNRVLQDWRRSGIIDLGRSRVHVKVAPRLAALGAPSRL